MPPKRKSETAAGEGQAAKRRGGAAGGGAKASEREKSAPAAAVASARSFVDKEELLKVVHLACMRLADETVAEAGVASKREEDEEYEEGERRHEFEPEVVERVACLVWDTVIGWGEELAAFASHANRTTVNADDVRLLMRKNPSLSHLVEERSGMLGVLPRKQRSGSARVSSPRASSVGPSSAALNPFTIASASTTPIPPAVTPQPGPGDLLPPVTPRSNVPSRMSLTSTPLVNSAARRLPSVGMSPITPGLARQAAGRGEFNVTAQATPFCEKIERAGRGNERREERMTKIEEEVVEVEDSPVERKPDRREGVGEEQRRREEEERDSFDDDWDAAAAAAPAREQAVVAGEEKRREERRNTSPDMFGSDDDLCMADTDGVATAVAATMNDSFEDDLVIERTPATFARPVFESRMKAAPMLTNPAGHPTQSTRIGEDTFMAQLDSPHKQPAPPSRVPPPVAKAAAEVVDLDSDDSFDQTVVCATSKPPAVKAQAPPSKTTPAAKPQAPPPKTTPVSKPQALPSNAMPVSKPQVPPAKTTPTAQAQSSGRGTFTQDSFFDDEVITPNQSAGRITTSAASNRENNGGGGGFSDDSFDDDLEVVSAGKGKEGGGGGKAALPARATLSAVNSGRGGVSTAVTPKAASTSAAKTPQTAPLQQKKLGWSSGKISAFSFDDDDDDDDVVEIVGTTPPPATTPTVSKGAAAVRGGTTRRGRGASTSVKRKSNERPPSRPPSRIDQIMDSFDEPFDFDE